MLRRIQALASSLLLSSVGLSNNWLETVFCYNPPVFDSKNCTRCLYRWTPPCMQQQETAIIRLDITHFCVMGRGSITKVSYSASAVLVIHPRWPLTSRRSRNSYLEKKIQSLLQIGTYFFFRNSQLQPTLLLPLSQHSRRPLWPMASLLEELDILITLLNDAQTASVSTDGYLNTLSRTLTQVNFSF